MIQLKSTAKAVTLLTLCMLLAGCQANMAAKNDPNSRFYWIRPGTKLVLNQEISIGAERATAYFMHGQQVNGIDGYEVGCGFEVRQLGPVVVKPDTFIVRRAESDREWISHPNIMRFYRVIYLLSEQQPDVMKLECQTWDGPLWPSEITVPQIREALGEIFTLKLQVPGGD